MLFRKFAPQYLTKHASERSLRLIETLPMGDKRSIALVQAGAQRFLLASTPGQITLLTAISDAVGASPLSAMAPAEVPSTAALTGNFKNLYEQEKKAIPMRPVALKALPPDIRGKMQELRKSLEG
jgi:flagellar biogenesis protein FliO